LACAGVTLLCAASSDSGDVANSANADAAAAAWAALAVAAGDGASAGFASSEHPVKSVVARAKIAVHPNLIRVPSLRGPLSNN